MTDGEVKDENQNVPSPGSYEVLDKLTASQLETVEKLREIQKQSDSVEEEFRKELSDLKKKFDERFSKFHEQRAKMLIKDTTMGTSELPNFWLTAMQNHPLLAEMVEEYDKPILEYLQNITCTWLGDVESQGFQVTFHFATNPFFENLVLSKKYKLTMDGRQSVLESAEGSDIIWRAGKNVTQRTVTRTQRNKKTKQTRTVTHVEENESFFNFFKNLTSPGEGAAREDIEEYDVLVDTEYEVGMILKEKIVPHSVGWYLAEERDPEHDEDEFDDEESDDDSGSSSGSGDSD